MFKPLQILLDKLFNTLETMQKEITEMLINHSSYSYTSIDQEIEILWQGLYVLKKGHC